MNSTSGPYFSLMMHNCGPFRGAVPSHNEDITEKFKVVENAIAKLDVSTILSDRELFWTAHCRAMLLNPGHKDRDFNVYNKNERIWVKSSPEFHRYHRRFNDSLYEEFTKGFKNLKNFNVLFVKKDFSFFYTKDVTPVIFDLGQDGVYHEAFTGEILPILGVFAQSLGVTINVLESEEMVTYVGSSGLNFDPVMKNVTRLKVEWLRDITLTYTVSPKKIEPRVSCDAALYRMYLDKKHCDFTFSVQDESVQLHSLIVRINCGDAITRLLDSGMKEVSENKIEFSDCSFTTVITFVDYLYLGIESVNAESFQGNLNKLVQLFQFAHAYQVLPLIDHCANLFSLLADKSDVDQIRELGETYENSYLLNLADALSAATPSVTTGGAAGAGT